MRQKVDPEDVVQSAYRSFFAAASDGHYDLQRAGDLLLAMACAQSTLVGEALRELDLDLDMLWGTLERIRQQRVQERKALTDRINEVRADKARALAGQDFEQAGPLLGRPVLVLVQNCIDEVDGNVFQIAGNRCRLGRELRGEMHQPLFDGSRTD